MKLSLINIERGQPDPPLRLGYLAAYIRKYYGLKNITIIDNENFLKRIKKEKPDIIGMTALSLQIHEANNLAGEIKKNFDIPVIIGGHHISMMPLHLLSSNFDVGVVGEGEQTLLELTELYERRGELTPEHLQKIDGIIFKKDNRLETTKPRGFIEPLDRIPFPARDLLRMKELYLNPRKGSFDEIGVYTSLLTSRGCPYNCAFCSAIGIWKRKFRAFSAEYVVDEIKELLKNYKGLDGIIIWDDLFIADRLRLKKIAGLIKEEGIDQKLKFTVYGRTNLMSEDVCIALRDMNAKVVDFGLESGSDKVLNFLKKGTLTVQQNKDGLRMAKKFGFKTIGTLIIGSPDETEEDLKQTMDLVKDENLDEPYVFQLVPLPGTDIWKYAESNGIVSNGFDFDYEKLAINNFHDDIIMTKNMTGRQLKEWLDKFQTEVHKKRHKISLRSLRPRHLRYFMSPKFLKKVIRNSDEYSKFVKNKFQLPEK